MTKTLGMSDEFAGTFRAALIDQVNSASRSRFPRRRTIVISVIAVALLGGGAATAAAGGFSAQESEVNAYNLCMQDKGWTPKVRLDSGDWIFETQTDEERARFGDDSNECIEQISVVP